MYINNEEKMISVLSEVIRLNGRHLELHVLVRWNTYATRKEAVPILNKISRTAERSRKMTGL